MRLPEQRLWDRLSRTMSGIWEACRIESRVDKSAPDVFFSHPDLHGWIELKVHRAPVRRATRFKIENWTAGQQDWARRHAGNLSSVWVCMHVAGTDSVYFLGAPDALAAQNRISWEEFERRFEGQRLSFKFMQGRHVLDTLQEAWFNSCVNAAMAPRTLGEAKSS